MHIFTFLPSLIISEEPVFAVIRRPEFVKIGRVSLFWYSDDDTIKVEQDIKNLNEWQQYLRAKQNARTPNCVYSEPYMKTCAK